MINSKNQRISNAPTTSIEESDGISNKQKLNHKQKDPAMAWTAEEPKKAIVIEILESDSESDDDIPVTRDRTTVSQTQKANGNINLEFVKQLKDEMKSRAMETANARFKNHTLQTETPKPVVMARPVPKGCQMPMNRALVLAQDPDHIFVIKRNVGPAQRQERATSDSQRA
ncbi:hypothetical protein EJ08DRAFT_346952 [Tothia fuscella]|uniref:Uncharacterized protein n=1 Tax=Tothia fuscella TaxID=1048955 RepID=A0A9P4TWJ3_9PEZI|nr:hypothetical protein EJ08DRAFT_346952 [Tothia fuscella]